jgi:two-component system chemotaxis response regulator CheB
MSEKPTPIVVVSASVECEDLQITMNALQAGALTVLEKPAGTTSADYEALSQRLCTQLANISQVKVVRRHPSARSAPRAERRSALPRDDYKILGLVSSTGGPNALVQLLGSLGPGFRLPIALVQHITGSFLEGFASWLEKACGLPVVIVKERTRLQPGQVYLANRDRHLRVLPGYVQVDEGDPVCAQRPSGTVLFDSIADAYGVQAIGTLLTGMGDDGAQGLLRLRNQGGFTIAEHESTAVVYGMPGEAVRLGGVCESLPLPEIAPRILDLTFSKKEVA